MLMYRNHSARMMTTVLVHCKSSIEEVEEQLHTRHLVVAVRIPAEEDVGHSAAVVHTVGSVHNLLAAVVVRHTEAVADHTEAVGRIAAVDLLVVHRSRLVGVRCSFADRLEEHHSLAEERRTQAVHLEEVHRLDDRIALHLSSRTWGQWSRAGAISHRISDIGLYNLRYSSRESRAYLDAP